MSEVVEPPSNQRTLWRPVYGSFVFALGYLVAVYLGRLTVIDGENLNLAWPAAGVMALWFSAHRGSKLLIVDSVLAAVTAMSIDLATGTTLPLACAFVIANFAQTFGFMWLFVRLVPDVDVGGRTRRLGRVNELLALIICASVASAIGAAIGPTAVWAEYGVWSWAGAAVWMARNAVSIVLLGSLGVGIAYWLREHKKIEFTGRRFAEFLTIVAMSIAADFVVFSSADHLPLSFLLLLGPMTVGVRFNTTVTAAYNLAFSVSVVVLTVAGLGAFRSMESNVQLALATQALLLMVVLLSQGLALSRGQQLALFNEVSLGRSESERLASRLETILESLTEGLAVVDASGAIVMRNSAGNQLMGGVTSSKGTVEDPGYYGLFHLDGSPIAPEDIGYHQALKGKEVRGEYMVVRNPGVPEGRVLSVNAVPLPGADGGAVVVFRDVTEEKRKQDDLTAFAGVVAHDLMAPLAAVKGWSEVLEDAFNDLSVEDAEKQQLFNGISRVQGASTRMSALIEDLLSFATAENANVKPSAFELNDLVNEVVNGRLDSLSPGDTYLPVFAVGDLGTVWADVSLVRQLLDNLIGNAIKYVAPGVRPEIAITAETVNNHRIQISIADNGIGIPDGQHAKIFGEFYRAHRDSDYAGTGIGLSVCRRIVERHGGIISAIDNPAGGSSFVFTLPSPPKSDRFGVSKLSANSESVSPER